jgi:hypothetical protein
LVVGLQRALEEAQEKLGRLAEMENEYKRENRKCKKLLAARLLQDEMLAAAQEGATKQGGRMRSAENQVVALQRELAKGTAETLDMQRQLTELATSLRQQKDIANAYAAGGGGGGIGGGGGMGSMGGGDEWGSFGGPNSGGGGGGGGDDPNSGHSSNSAASGGASGGGEGPMVTAKAANLLRSGMEKAEAESGRLREEIAVFGVKVADQVKKWIPLYILNRLYIQL